MRKLLVLPLVIILTLLCGCFDDPLYTVSYSKPVVVPPDEDTNYTINGYKEINSNPSSSQSKSENTTSVEEPVYNGRYLGNINTKKLHKTTCSYIKKTNEENIEIFEDINSAVLKGYSVCKRCLEE